MKPLIDRLLDRMISSSSPPSLCDAAVIRQSIEKIRSFPAEGSTNAIRPVVVILDRVWVLKVERNYTCNYNPANSIA